MSFELKRKKWMTDIDFEVYSALRSCEMSTDELKKVLGYSLGVNEAVRHLKKRGVIMRVRTRVGGGAVWGVL